METGTGQESPRSTQRRIQEVREAIREKNWGLARRKCDEDWTELREQIGRGESADETASTNAAVLVKDGFALTYESARPFDREPNLTGDLRGPGTCRTYSVAGPANVLLQLESFELEDSLADQPVWLICRDAFQSPPEFQRLASGMRLGSKRTARGGRAYDIGVARFNTGAKRGSSINKVGTVELNEIVDGDVEALLTQVGATQFGLRSELLRDTSKRKNYLCAIDESGSATGLAATIYFLTRVLPIARHLGLR